MSRLPPDLLERVVDIQYLIPENRLFLPRVGVRNLKVQLKVSSKRGVMPLSATIDLFVDLPRDMKGVNLSRHPESLIEVLEPRLLKVPRIEEMCANVAVKLLEKHEYAKRSEVRLKSDYFVETRPPHSNHTFKEPCKIYASAAAERNNNIVKFVGARVSGFTACPCTQNLMKALAEDKLKELGYADSEIKRIVEAVPIATHTQRAYNLILLEEPAGFIIDVEDIIEVARAALSGGTYTILKRPSEVSVVKAGVERAMFVEDVVRASLASLAERYRELPDETRVYVQAYSEECVHHQDLVAERHATLKDIREELNTR
jgi:GTP cyclohydrolase-4